MITIITMTTVTGHTRGGRTPGQEGSSSSSDGTLERTPLPPPETAISLWRADFTRGRGTRVQVPGTFRQNPTGLVSRPDRCCAEPRVCAEKPDMQESGSHQGPPSGSRGNSTQTGSIEEVTPSLLVITGPRGARAKPPLP